MNSFGQSLLSTPAPTKTIPKAASAAAALPVAATRWCLDIMCSQIFIRRTRPRRYTSSSRYRYSNPGRYRTTEDEWEIHDNFQPFVATCRVRADSDPCGWVGIFICTWKGFHFLHPPRVRTSEWNGCSMEWAYSIVSAQLAGWLAGVVVGGRREMTKLICSLFPFCDRSIG